MTRSRSAVLAALVGLFLLAAPTAARAEVTLTAPERVTEAGVVALRATTDPSPDPTRLTLRGPGDVEPVVVATNAETPAQVTGGELGVDLDTRCARYPAGEPCASPLLARNGVWTLALEGGNTATRDFVLAVGAEKPVGVTATPDGPTALVVGWQRGVEPDVRWTLLEGNRTLVADLTPADVCTDGACEARLAYSAGSARERTVTVRAVRACPGCGAQPAVAGSAASATLPDAPAAAGPGPADPDGPDSGAAPTQPNGEPLPEADRARADAAFGAFVPRGQPTVPQGLPAVPGQAAAPALPGTEIGPDTFEETLDYGEDRERTVVEGTSTPVIRTVTRALGAVGGALDSERVARTGAGALVVLLLAGHLRVWARSARTD